MSPGLSEFHLVEDPMATGESLSHDVARAREVHQARRLAEEEELMRDISLRNSPAYRACWAVYQLMTQQTPIPHDLRGYLEANYEGWNRIEAALMVVTWSPEGFKTLPPMQALTWLSEQGVNPPMLNLVCQDVMLQQSTMVAHAET